MRKPRITPKEKERMFFENHPEIEGKCIRFEGGQFVHKYGRTESTIELKDCLLIKHGEFMSFVTDFTNIKHPIARIDRDYVMAPLTDGVSGQRKFLHLINGEPGVIYAGCCKFGIVVACKEHGVDYQLGETLGPRCDKLTCKHCEAHARLLKEQQILKQQVKEGEGNIKSIKAKLRWNVKHLADLQAQSEAWKGSSTYRECMRLGVFDEQPDRTSEIHQVLAENPKLRGFITSW